MTKTRAASVRTNREGSFNWGSIALATTYSQAVSWLIPELTALPSETLAEWMAQSAELAVYRQWFDDLFRPAARSRPRCSSPDTN